mgnify:CR=1 FL=1
MKIARIKKGSWGKIVAFFDLEVMGLVLKGFKIIEGNDGMFVGFPSQKDADGNYFDTIHASKEVKDKVYQLALTAYGNEKTNQEHVGTASDDAVVPF